MKNNRLLIIIIFFSIITSCSENSGDYNNVIINSEKSKKWNLPELNLTSKIPKNYKLSYNESGGFYLQARKFDTIGKLLAEISIGRIEGELKNTQITKALNDANKTLKEQLKNIKQIKYETFFVGEELINNKNLKILRGIIEFDNFQKNIDGKFYTFMTPIILDEKNKFMLSSMFKENGRNDKNRIEIELLDFMKSIKVEN